MGAGEGGARSLCKARPENPELGSCFGTFVFYVRAGTCRTLATWSTQSGRAWGGGGGARSLCKARPENPELGSCFGTFVFYVRAGTCRTLATWSTQSGRAWGAGEGGLEAYARPDLRTQNWGPVLALLRFTFEQGLAVPQQPGARSRGEHGGRGGANDTSSVSTAAAPGADTGAVQDCVFHKKDSGDAEAEAGGAGGCHER